MPPRNEPNTADCSSNGGSISAAALTCESKFKKKEIANKLTHLRNGRRREDDIFKVRAAAGHAPTRGEDFDNNIVDIDL